MAKCRVVIDERADDTAAVGTPEKRKSLPVYRFEWAWCMFVRRWVFAVSQQAGLSFVREW